MTGGQPMEDSSKHSKTDTESKSGDSPTPAENAEDIQALEEAVKELTAVVRNHNRTHQNSAEVINLLNKRVSVLSEMIKLQRAANNAPESNDDTEPN